MAHVHTRIMEVTMEVTPGGNVLALSAGLKWAELLYCVFTAVLLPCPPLQTLDMTPDGNALALSAGLNMGGYWTNDYAQQCYKGGAA